VDKPQQIVKATLEAMLLAQAFRPLADRAGIAGAYAADTFASMLATQLERRE
jgi:hypothetical protein